MDGEGRRMVTHPRILETCSHAPPPSLPLLTPTPTKPICESISVVVASA